MKQATGVCLSYLMVVEWGDRRLFVCALCCNYFRIIIFQVSVYVGCRLVIT